MELKQWDEAIACYRQAIELDPKDAWVYASSATPCRSREAGRGHRLLPARPSNSTRNRLGPRQPRHRPEGSREAGRGHRLLPPSPRTRPETRLGPRQPRRRPAGSREAGRGHRLLPPSHRTRPEIARHTAPRHRPEGPGKAGRGHRLLPQGHRTRSERRLGPRQPRRRPAGQGKLDEAIACYRQAIELDPNGVCVYGLLGMS